MAQLKVTQVRSTIGQKPKARESVRSLGLKKIHQSVLVEDTPQTRGYLHAARHLLSVAEADAEAGKSGTAGTKRAGK